MPSAREAACVRNVNSPSTPTMVRLGPSRYRPITVPYKAGRRLLVAEHDDEQASRANHVLRVVPGPRDMEPCVWPP